MTTECKDVRVGIGIVCWADDADMSRMGRGWVLPGGERTTDRERAEAVARNIDRLIKDGGGAYARMSLLA